MTSRAEQAGLAFAAVAHLVLLGLLSVAWSGQPPRVWPAPTPLEVSLVDTVAPDAQAPPAPEPPPASIAPEVGTPEDAAPPPAPAPQPVARPEPATAAPARPTSAPAAQARPQPLAPARPAAARPAPARPSDRLAGLASSLSSGSRPNATATRPRGARLGNDFLAGLAPDSPRRTPSPAAPAARAGPYPTASIVQAIARQIQPCADRQVNPGPGANRIITTLNIRLNPNGTLAATPTRVRQSGVGEENERYAQRVTDLGVAAFKGCSPLRLPPEYYRTENGGWNNINYQWQLR